MEINQSISVSKCSKLLNDGYSNETQAFPGVKRGALDGQPRLLFLSHLVHLLSFPGMALSLCIGHCAIHQACQDMPFLTACWNTVEP